MPQQLRLSLEQKLRFIAAVTQGNQTFRQLCCNWHISRQTGYKWLRRSRQGGLSALAEASRAPHRRPHALPQLWVERIARLRRKHPRWGPKKLRAALGQQHRRARLPARSTIGACLLRLGLLVPRRRRLPGPTVRTRRAALVRQANDVWTVDFKGWFRTLDGQRVDPLTVRDLASRFGLRIKILSGQKFLDTQTAFIGLFKQRGQPRAVRMDNGSPFGSSGTAGLSSLSAWFVSLGIEVQYTRRGHPEDNGSHEQWHRVFKAETTQPPAATPALQAARTTRWLRQYNYQRPHEALAQQPPVRHYRKSRTRYRGIRFPHYPKAWLRRRVHLGGEIKWRGRVRFVGEAFAGYQVALQSKRPGVWAVYFYHILLGYLHDPDASGLRPTRRTHPVQGPQKV
jgi:transposase InsO family protein